MTEVTTGRLPESLFGERLITADAATGNPVECSSVAVIVTFCGFEIVPGAVYSPVADMVPNPLRFDQTTAVSDVPVTPAVNCKLCDGVRTALEGLTRMMMLLLLGRS